MDIHKPKPVHNLREFLSEIGIIVIGVLIALGLEQAVEAWHWHHQVETTERALRADLLGAYDNTSERIAIAGCVEHRLDEITGIVDRASVTGRLAPVGRLGNPPNWVWNQGAWDSALAGQTAEHIGNDRRRAYAEMYGFVTRLRDDNLRDNDVWNALYTLVGPGRAVTPAEIATWYADIGRARLQNQVMALLSVRFRQLIDSSPIGGEKGAQSQRFQPGSKLICQPIGPAPAHYGNAVFENAIEHARQTPITSNFPPEH